MHPLLNLAATRPQLLVEHAAAYAELAQCELACAGSQLKRQAVLGLATACLVGLAVGLAGTACLLAAVVPVGQMVAPWALWLVPLVPALAAAACGWALGRSPRQAAFEKLRAQVGADAALWRDMSAG